MLLKLGFRFKDVAAIPYARVQMAKVNVIEDLRDAMTKVQALEEVDTHDEQWKVLLITSSG